MNIQDARTTAKLFAQELSRAVPSQQVEIREDLAEDLTTEPYVLIGLTRQSIPGFRDNFLVRAFFNGQMVSSVGLPAAVPAYVDIIAENVEAERARMSQGSVK